MQIIYTKKPKIHILRNGKAVCGRRWLDGEEESSKFAGSVDCKDCLRLLTPRAPGALCSCYMPEIYQQHNPPLRKCAKCGKPARR